MRSQRSDAVTCRDELRQAEALGDYCAIDTVEAKCSYAFFLQLGPVVDTALASLSTSFAADASIDVAATFATLVDAELSGASGTSCFRCYSEFAVALTTRRSGDQPVCLDAGINDPDCLPAGDLNSKAVMCATAATHPALTPCSYDEGSSLATGIFGATGGRADRLTAGFAEARGRLGVLDPSTKACYKCAEEYVVSTHDSAGTLGTCGLGCLATAATSLESCIVAQRQSAIADVDIARCRPDQRSRVNAAIDSMDLLAPGSAFRQAADAAAGLTVIAQRYLQLYPGSFPHLNLPCWRCVADKWTALFAAYTGSGACVDATSQACVTLRVQTRAAYHTCGRDRTEPGSSQAEVAGFTVANALTVISDALQHKIPNTNWNLGGAVVTAAQGSDVSEVTAATACLIPTAKEVDRLRELTTALCFESGSPCDPLTLASAALEDCTAATVSATLPKCSIAQASAVVAREAAASSLALSCRLRRRSPAALARNAP